jgi:RNase H-fold protein (predicted Holliday junction resolvase)
MNIKELHNHAMELADLADLQKIQGNTDGALSLYEQSYHLEYEAAMAAYDTKVGEPSISVLLRSAASLAMNCQKNRDAEKLIALALSGEPPLEIAEELRNLLENVYFARHLDLKGIQLSDGEVQLVIAGKGVGYGYARTEEITNRITTFQNLTLRTVERMSGKSFRKSGPISPELKIFNNPYMSSFNAASMAFRIRFGNPQQPTLAGFSGYESIIDDITENISLINDNKIDILKERINDTTYFDNFMALTKELAPDGDAVSEFGITSIKQGQERKTILTSKRETIIETIRKISQENESVSESSEERETNQIVVGILKAANATNNSVEIISEDKAKIKLKVPDGLSDIVRKYWDESVSVEYCKKGAKTNLLVNIEDRND